MIRPSPIRVISTPAVLALLVGLVVGCETNRPVPSGAQLISVEISASGVVLSPSTARAGPVYLVADTTTAGGGFSFVSRQVAGQPEGVLAPLTDDDLARVGTGDTEGTSMSGWSSGCSASQQAEARGRIGPCGNVSVWVLAPGKYVILGPEWVLQETEAGIDPTAQPGSSYSPRALVVLEILP